MESGDEEVKSKKLDHYFVKAMGEDDDDNTEDDDDNKNDNDDDDNNDDYRGRWRRR